MMGQMSEPKITPLARRLAEENGIDWRRIEGTGPDGEITERDILNFLAKVMAGEVTLEGPPPGEPPAPEGQADLEAARAALAKEGVPLDELIPKDTAPPEPTTDFELDIDLLEGEAEPPPETPVAPDITAELPVYHEEPPAEAEDVPVFQEETEPLANVTTELPLYEEEVPAPPPEPEPPLEETPPIPVEEPEEPEQPEEPAAVLPEAAAVAAAVPAAAAPLEPEPEPEQAPAEEVLLWVETVPLEPMAQFAQELEAELGRDVAREALLFLAAKRALADLEVPLRPLKDRYQVPPSENFTRFLAAWEEANEEGQGLRVAESGLPLTLTAPALVLVAEGAPEGQALLVLAGELPTDGGRFLKRVAHYLEKPIRLLLF